MRVALVGAVESTRTAGRALVEAGVRPTLVTLPGDLLTRHSDAVDLREDSEELGLEIFETRDVNSQATLDRFRDVSPDYVFVIGWSQICGPEFLAVPDRGAIGFHPAALPKNRGRAVIPWTILQGTKRTGSTLFWMDEGMDTGDILMQAEIEVAPRETARSLYDKHMAALERMIADATTMLRSGQEPRDPQNHANATYCSQRRPEDGWLNWTLLAPELDSLVRASTRPYPGAFTLLGDQVLKIWGARPIEHAPYWGIPGQVQALDAEGALIQCGGRTHLLVTEVQLEDEPAGPAAALLHRHQRLGPYSPGQDT